MAAHGNVTPLPKMTVWHPTTTKISKMAPQDRTIIWPPRLFGTEEYTLQRSVCDLMGPLPMLLEILKFVKSIDTPGISTDRFHAISKFLAIFEKCYIFVTL